MPIQKLETTNVLKQWMDTINTIIDDSSELESRLNEKVDKETGKGLSTNDFTNTLKDKLDGIEEGANNYTLPTANNATKGGVTLSDSTSSESGTDDGIAATPKAVKIAYDLASKALPKAGGTIEGDLTVTGKINATIEGNTDTANKLSVARTIALTGDVSGSTTFDGTQDVSITVTVADDSHSHTIANIDNLETILATKAGTTSPTFVGIPKAPTAQAGTNTTQIATTAFVQSAIDSKIATADAMIFKGTIGVDGVVSELPAEHSIGWTYKVATVGIYAGVNCEVGDMIVCLADGTTANDADWTVIQTNIDGAVTGPASAVEERIAVFSGTTGKIIKDSGYTISTSVPADAKFTDTTYSAENGISLTGTTFSNSGVRSVVSGTANGTISVNTNGTSVDVAVKGLGSAAFTETTAYTEVAHKSVVASKDTNGHVKLSDDTNSDSGVAHGVAATPAAVKSAYDLANAALPKTGGTITGDLTVTGKINASIEGVAESAISAEKLSNARTIALAGDATGSATFDGSEDISISVTVADDSHNHTVENIDNLETLLASKAAIVSPTFTGAPKAPTATAGTNTTQSATTAFVTTAVNTAVDGAVYGPETSSVGNIAIFNDANGNSVSDSGFTIASSVPADAKFTDTTYNVGSAVEAGITKLYTETGNNTDGTINQDALTTLFDGKLGINDTAVKATSDASGNVITTTYATKEELSNIGDSLADVATSGSYNDLSDKPTALKNPNSLTIQNSTGTSVCSYDGSTATTVKLTASTVGLDNVTNESKDTMFTSPALTGTPTAPTAPAGTNTTQVATTAFVSNAIAELVDTAPETLNTLGEIASALSENVGVTDALNEAIATKANDSDVVKLSGDQSIAGTKTFTSTISGSVSGNAGTADKLKTAHTIALSGDASGSVKFDGSEDVSITVTVADDSHNHTIDNIDNLETLLATKAGLSSPALVGTPTAPTATDGTNTTQIATTAFVTKAIVNQVALDEELYATKEELSNIGDNLADVATSGSYNDLSDKPTALKNPTSLTIQNSAGTSIGSYDGSTATTVKLTSATVGLDNVTNESKATMFTSPAFTGTPTAPTASEGTNTTQVATTAFVSNAVELAVEGAVYGPSESTDSTVAVFDGITGNLLKDSGYTIASSVPADAKFTDTTYTGTDGITLTGTTFSNSGVRSISSGSTNGTISVNTNGTSTEVVVKGLGSAAFTNSSDYLPIDGGIITGDLAVDGTLTANIEGNASSADVLTVSDTGNATTPVYFEGGIPVAISHTIASSVPANAKFTDTTYTVGTTNYSGTTKLYTSVGDNTDGTINQSALTTLLSGKLGATDTAVRATSDANGNNIASTYATKEELGNIGDSLADVAISGSYNDLTDKPTSLKNPTSLIIQNSTGTSVGSYDGSTATTVKLTSDTVGLGNVTNESKATMFSSPAFTGTPTAPTAANTTNTTQIATTAFVQSVVDSKIAASDAMIYKGTIGTGGTVTALPNTHSTGWTYKVITAGTYAGVECNVGDMIICLTDGTAANNAHWTVVEGNIDGAVTGPASSVASNVAIFDGATGKVIKDSGYTIESSVPANAKFTDTTYTGSDGITLTGTNFTNSGVRSISSGSTNGTISVNTNGTSAEVAVKGLGSAAFTESSAYAPDSHISVAANGSSLGHVKLSDSVSSTSGVTGGFAATPKAVKTAYDLASAALPKTGGTITGDLTVEGVFEASVSNAATADKLTSAGTITLAGDASGSVAFDGTDATLTVTIADDSHNHTVENIDNLETLLASKAAIASPTFTGSPKAPTATAGTNNTQIATTAFVTTAVANKTSVESATKAEQDASGNIITTTYATKEEMHDIINSNLAETSELIWTVESDVASDTIITLPNNFVYPVSCNAIRVSLDGAVMSAGLNYEEVIDTSASDVAYSGKIKFLCDLTVGMVVHIWITPTVTINFAHLQGNINSIQQAVIDCESDRLICEEALNSLNPENFLPISGGTLTGSLTVEGDITASGNITGSAVYNAVWNDYAEFFPRGEETKAGDFVALSLDSDNEVYVKASKKTSKSVGIHSDSFGHLIGGEQAPKGQDFVEYNLPKYIPVGLVGRVRANIVGEVKKGDFIVISDISGVGRAFNKEIDSYVDIIGMACESSSEKDIKRIKVKLGN